VLALVTRRDLALESEAASRRASEGWFLEARGIHTTTLLEVAYLSMSPVLQKM
jgi:hypothetical protein